MSFSMTSHGSSMVGHELLHIYIVFPSSLLLSTLTRRRFTLSDLVDKPWSQVSSLLAPGTGLYFYRA